MSFCAVSSTITRPNNGSAATAGILVANSATAASVTPFKFGFPYPGIKIYNVGVSKGSSSATKFTVHLFNSSPTIFSGDSTSISVASAGYLTSYPVDLSTVTQFSSGAGVSALGASSAAGSANPLLVTTEMGSGGCFIYGLLAANSSYTPSASESYTVTIYAEYPALGR